MMNQQPDDFFREKLGSFHKRAPAGAWDRIESKFEENNKYGWWWKIAATILLLAATTYLLVPGPEMSRQQPFPLSETVPGIPDAETNIALKEEAPDRNTSEIGPMSQKKITTKKISDKKGVLQKINTKPAQEKKDVTQNIFKEGGNSNNLAQLFEATSRRPEHVSEPVATKKITLKFSAKEANEYLDKNAIAEATSGEKKSSTFKKLLMRANDLKSNQDHFGDLREKKNEILALNFKNEKRRQN